MSDLRIPFEIAVTEPKLLKAQFDRLSMPQQVALKAAYGCKLSAEKRDAKGWSELDYWAMLQGHCEYDSLGNLTRVLPNPPAYQEGKEWPEVWACVGIRGGKTDSICATAVAYEATCGGHEGRIRKGKRAAIFLIAQNLRYARWALPGILSVLESMPLIHPPGAKVGEKGSKILRTTADTIDLWNGMTIICVPPSVKAVRGFDSPVAVLDEVGVWAQELDSANPDFEIYSQVNSRQAQFTHPKIFGVSSPWTKSGLLYERVTAGTEGSKLSCNSCRTQPNSSCLTCAELRLRHRNRLILHTTTAGLGNPLVTQKWLQSASDKDPKVFERECLSQFVDAITGFLDANAIAEATDHGIKERSPLPNAFYIAAIDPAFRHDAFGFCICHVDEDRAVVIDVLRRWPEAGDGNNKAPLNPSTVLDEIKTYLTQYRVVEVVSDQYNIDTLQQLALVRGFGIRQVTFTGSSKAEMYGNLQQLLRQKKFHIIDHEETLRELRSIEKRNMPGGQVKIGAPKGAHDDMATVVALASHQSMWLSPRPEAEVKKEPTPFELCMKQIDRNRRGAFDRREVW